MIIYYINAKLKYQPPQYPPLSGWVLGNSVQIGSRVLYDGVKGAVNSSVLITPNTAEVSRVLRGGVAAYALSTGVEQLLGAVDWGLDSENNQVKYTKQEECTTNCQVQYTLSRSRPKLFASM